MTGRRAKSWRRLLFALIPVVGLLLAFEIGLRLVPARYWSANPPSPPNRRVRFRPDRNLIHVAVPGSRGFNVKSSGEFAIPFRINRFGHRDVPHRLAKAPGVKRILLLSDSFGEGLQVKLDQIMARRLAALLKKHRPDQRFEIINAGVSGYSTILHYLYLKRKGSAFCPDLVIVAMIPRFVGRDVKYRAWCRLDARGLPLRCSHPSLLGIRTGLGVRIWRWIKRHVRLVQFLGERWDRLFPDKDDPYLINNDDTPRGKRAWAWTTKLLLNIDRLCRAAGARLLVVLIPNGSQIRAERPPIPMRTDFSHTGPQRILGRFCRQKGIAFLDLLPTFKASTDRPLYFPIDRHLTSAGHLVAARAVWRFLEDHRALLFGPKSVRCPSGHGPGATSSR